MTEPPTDPPAGSEQQPSDSGDSNAATPQGEGVPSTSEEEEEADLTAAEQEDEAAAARIGAAMDRIRQRISEELEPSRERLAQQVATALAPAMERLSEQLAPQLQNMSEVIAAALPRFKIPTLRLSPELLENLQRVFYRPPNWPEQVDIERSQAVMQDDGIPLVWVPRSETVAIVLDAEDRQARVLALLEREADCLSDCRDALAEMKSVSTAGHVVLAQQALEAFEAGHPAAAQALAVVVLESATRVAIYRNSSATAHAVKSKSDLTRASVTELRLWAALAPLVPFFEGYEDDASPGPRPTALRRHLTVHSAKPDQYTRANGLIALLLLSSVLSALEELQAERIRRGDPRWPWK